MKIRDLLSSKVTRNASWIIAGRVYHMLLAFFVGLGNYHSLQCDQGRS